MKNISDFVYSTVFSGLWCFNLWFSLNWVCVFHNSFGWNSDGKIISWNRGHWKHEEGCQYWHTGRQKVLKRGCKCKAIFTIIMYSNCIYIHLITKYNYDSSWLAVLYCHYVDIKPCIDFTSVSFRCKGYILQYSLKAKWVGLLYKSVELAKNFLHQSTEVWC